MDQNRRHPTRDPVGGHAAHVRAGAVIEAIGSFALVAAAGLAVFSACPLAALVVAVVFADAFHAAAAVHDLASGGLTWPTVWVFLVGQIIAGFFAWIAFLTFGWWAYYDD